MILLDTSAVMWLAYEPDRLGVGSQDLLREDDVYFSAVAAVEVTIKSMAGRLPESVLALPHALAGFGLTELVVTSAHATAMAEFPELKGHDPFGRLYMAQAHTERAALLTSDRRLLGLGYDWVVDARS